MGQRGPGPGRQISRGSILKKIEIELWYAGKKRLSTREKFKGDQYWKHYNVLSFVSFLCCFCLHITEYEQMVEGGQSFLGPRGVKYLNTGLPIPDSESVITQVYSHFTLCSFLTQTRDCTFHAFFKNHKCWSSSRKLSSASECSVKKWYCTILFCKHAIPYEFEVE
jgi:hypothetical protein